MIFSKRRHSCGHALLEFLLWSTATATVALYGAVILGEYGTARLQAVSAARLAAWQRTAWVPAHIMSSTELDGVEGATRKDDKEITRDIIRHTFLDASYGNSDLHSEANSEFNSTVLASSSKTVTVTTTIQENTTALDYKDRLREAWDTAKAKLKSDDTYNPTNSLGKFAFWGNSYLKNEVKVKLPVSDNLKKILNETSNGYDAQSRPDAFEITEHVTMFTEPWNAGGTIREQVKIQGLVPTRMLDSKVARDTRGPLEKIAQTIHQAIPQFNKDLVSFGFAPGGAPDKAPLDRFEQEKDLAGELRPGYFRPYRSFPPPPFLTQIQ